MLVSGVLLGNAVDPDNNEDKPMSGWKIALVVVFFMIELLFAIYALAIAMKCARSAAERLIHIVLAVSLPVPYVMLNTAVNECAKGLLF